MPDTVDELSKPRVEHQNSDVLRKNGNFNLQDNNWSNVAENNAHTVCHQPFSTFVHILALNKLLTFPREETSYWTIIVHHLWIKAIPSLLYKTTILPSSTHPLNQGTCGTLPTRSKI